MRTEEALKKIVDKTFEIVDDHLNEERQARIDADEELKQEVQEEIQPELDNLQDDIDELSGDLSTHTGDTNNPHNVTKSQIGLGDVVNVDITTLLYSVVTTGTTGTISQSDLDKLFSATYPLIINNNKLYYGVGVDGSNHIFVTKIKSVVTNDVYDILLGIISVQSSGNWSLQDNVLLSTYDYIKIDALLSNLQTTLSNSIDEETTRAITNETILEDAIDTLNGKIGIVELDYNDFDPTTETFTLTQEQLLEVGKKYCILIISSTENKITLYKNSLSTNTGQDNYAIFNTIPNVIVSNGVVSQISSRVVVNMTSGETTVNDATNTYYTSSKVNDLLSGKQDIVVIQATGNELEDLTYTAGTLYYCTSNSDSFRGGKLYMGTGSNSIELITSNTVSTNPAISTFTISPTSTEYGNAQTISYSYSLKKYAQFTSLTINVSGSVVNTLTPSASGSGTITGSYYNTTFTLTGVANGQTYTRNATISPIYRQYYYATDSTTTSTVLSNLKNVTSSTTGVSTYLESTRKTQITMNTGASASTPKYVYFVIPTTMSSITKVSSGGFEVPITTISTSTSFTNSYDASYSVRVYRTSSMITSSSITWDIE